MTLLVCSSSNRYITALHHTFLIQARPLETLDCVSDFQMRWQREEAFLRDRHQQQRKCVVAALLAIRLDDRMFFQIPEEQDRGQEYYELMGENKKHNIFFPFGTVDMHLARLFLKAELLTKVLLDDR